jgi:hypothetical protein
MNTEEPREPASTEGGQFGDDERVEVLVEDLFIEEYDPNAVQASPAKERGRFARAMSPLRTRKKPIVGGILALTGLALAAMLFSGRSRKTSRISRLLHRLGIAR